MKLEEKLSSIRSLMKKHSLDAYIIPSTDPHISEYVPDRWKSREWISGFTGSVATFVITANESGLWTDGRYFLQAEHKLKGSEIKLHKLGVIGYDDFPEWLNKNLKDGSTVGFDGWVLSVAGAQKLEKIFERKNIKINSALDLIEELWEDRPSLPSGEIFDQPVNFAGKSRLDKITEIRDGLSSNNCDSTLICSLDDICWTLNIRGRDVAYNPVAISYLFINRNSVKLFIEKTKVPFDLAKELENDGIDLVEYSEISQIDNKVGSSECVLIDPNRTNYSVYNLIKSIASVELAQNISTGLKAVKNETEISGMREAMRKDLVALINFNYWLETAVKNGEADELNSAAKLREFRAEQKLFFGESFNSIAGVAGNGAIIHYGSTPETNRKITSDTYFLLDSGGQYYDGTTDITRVFHFGKPTAQEKRDYTLVLKGMISLTLQKFPQGTRGGQLDVLARSAIWNEMINYAHGTGHGVGCFMNVHEGPQNIRTEINPTVLKEGMILSNEPGIYRTNEYGIRLENIILVKNVASNEFGDFMNFETLTLFPFDLNCIEKSLLSKDELNWLNDYHKSVYESAENYIDNDKKQWLKEKTRAI